MSGFHRPSDKIHVYCLWSRKYPFQQVPQKEIQEKKNHFLKQPIRGKLSFPCPLRKWAEKWETKYETRRYVHLFGLGEKGDESLRNGKTLEKPVDTPVKSNFRDKRYMYSPSIFYVDSCRRQQSASLCT